MTTHEYEQEGTNNGINWAYSVIFEKGEYRGSLQTEYNLIGNAELRLLNKGSLDNLDNHYIWYSLSDFFIKPEFRKKGFGKIMLERVANFAREQKIAIVKRIKAIPITEHKLDDLVHFLASHGFQRFDEKTYYYTHDRRNIGGKQNVNQAI